MKTNYTNLKQAMNEWQNWQIPRENLPLSERIIITQGNIISQQVEAIVNPTDNNLRSYGLCSKIHQAAGVALRIATRQIEWLDTSQAKITKGYQLRASYIIHTAAPVWDKTNSQTSSEQLVQCYRNCLQVAAENQIHTLAFPCISTGVRGFPKDWAAKIAITEALAFMQNFSLPWKIIFVCREQDNYEQYQANLPTTITSPTSSKQLQIAKQLVAQIRSEHRVAIIGSTSFRGVTTEAICNATGRQLARLENLALLTGGVSGIPEAVSRSFWRESQQKNKSSPVYHLQPEGSEPWEYGTNLYGGKTLSERREILASIASVYILIEGGSGAKHEARIAIASGALVIPVSVTGGCAEELYQEISRPYYIPDQLWQHLSQQHISSETVGKAIAEIIQKIWQRPRDVMFEPDKKSVTDLELRSALAVNYRKLRDLLAASQWQKADRETFRLFCEIALRVEVHKGVREVRKMLKTINKNIQPERFKELTNLLDHYQKMLGSIYQYEFPKSSYYDYVPGCLNRKFLKKLPILDVQTIDLLWMVYSGGRFGFTVQEKIWRTLCTQDEDVAMVEDNFINCVGRGYSQPGDAYREHEIFTLNSPEGLLPWLNWYDAEGNFHGIECDGDLAYLIGGLAQKGIFNNLWQERVRERLEIGDKDFSHCVLSNLDLQGLNFQGANLRGANLRGANCERGIFAKADLRGADLVGAKFSVGALQEAIIDQGELCDSQWLRAYTILIVDDSITVRQVLSTTFTNAGYLVEIARDGVEAWHQLQNNSQIDLVLLDIEMPNMNGYELTAKIRNDSYLKGIPIIILTNRAILKSNQKKFQQKYNYSGYLTKPFVEEVVLEKVKNIFNNNKSSLIT